MRIEICEKIIYKYNELEKKAKEKAKEDYLSDTGYTYFYEISDEDMQEMCEANDWEFLADGSLY